MFLRVNKYLGSNLGVYGFLDIFEDHWVFKGIIGVFLRAIKYLGSNLGVGDFLDVFDVHWVF